MADHFGEHLVQIDSSHLTRRTNLTEFLGHWDRRMARRPERKAICCEEQSAMAAELSPLLVDGAELWWWSRPNTEEPVSGSFGIAVVSSGSVVYSLKLGHKL